MGVLRQASQTNPNKKSTGDILHHLRDVVSGATGDRKPGSGDGYRMWVFISWALGRWNSQHPHSRPEFCKFAGDSDSYFKI
jgi:hypothetical protein